MLTPPRTTLKGGRSVRYRFGGFELDAGGYSLSRAGIAVEIEPKVFDLLLLLVRYPGGIVSRDVAVSALWPDAVVGPESLRRLVKEARRAVGDNGKVQRIIVTVRGRGLRFVAPVEVVGAELAAIYVGREELLRRIDDVLEEVGAGRRRTLLLRGEAGIGKTRAAQQIAERARLRQAEVVSAWATEEVGGGAYWSWRQVVDELIGSRDDVTLRRHLAGAGPQLVELSPALRERFPDLARLPVLEADAARIRLFDALRAFLSRAASDRPLVLILDDLHAADVHSLELVGFLGQTLEDAPVLLVAAYRAAEMESEPRRTQIIGEISAGTTTDTVDLEPFGHEDVAHMVEAYAGRRPPDELVSRLLSATGGNPLVLATSLRDVAEEDLQSWDWGDSLPMDFGSVIGRHLARLSLPARRVLRTASVLGREFEHAALERLHGSPATVQAALSEAHSAHVLLQGHAPDASRFVHALVRDTVYAELDGHSSSSCTAERA